MRKQYRILWIDDEPKRENNAIMLGKALNVSMDFRSIKSSTLLDVVGENKIDWQRTDLIIMDHSLINANDPNFRTGSSAAMHIREISSSCPIICVTGAGETGMDTRHRDAYETVIGLGRLSKSHDKILAMLKGFRALRKNPPANIPDFKSLFKVPEAEWDNFVRVMPHDLRTNFSDKSHSQNIFRWTEEVLFSRPGFLLNKDWACVFLGLNRKGFDSVSSLFSRARYKGIFSQQSNDRWWRYDLLYLLGKNTKGLGPSWEVGRELVDNDKKYFSASKISNRPFPETLAAMDSSIDADWVPMKIDETEPHTKYPDKLFFEELRQLKKLS